VRLSVKLRPGTLVCCHEFDADGVGDFQRFSGGVRRPLLG